MGLNSEHVITIHKRNVSFLWPYIKLIYHQVTKKKVPNVLWQCRATCPPHMGLCNISKARFYYREDTGRVVPLAICFVSLLTLSTYTLYPLIHFVHLYVKTTYGWIWRPILPLCHWKHMSSQPHATKSVL